MSVKVQVPISAVVITAAFFANSATAGTLTAVKLFDVPGASSGSTTAYNINNSGTIAGTYLDPAVGYRVFTLTNGVYATVDPPGSVNGSSLISINNAGQVVGFSNTATPPDYGSYYLASKGSFSAFPPPGITLPPGASYSFYNDVGAIGGQTATGAFIAQGSKITPITPPDGNNVTVNTINNSNQAVGGYFPAKPPSSTANQEGFLYGAGTFTPIYVPGSAVTYTTGISDAGVVVGYYNLAQVLPVNGVPYTPTLGFTYLNGAYTTYTVPGAIETELFAINSAGQVVGYERDGNGVSHAFVATAATAVPEPAALALVCAGLLGLVGLRRGRTS